MSCEKLYDSESGYGFVTEENRKKYDMLRIPELNSAFIPYNWCENEMLTKIQEDENGCFLDSKAIVNEAGKGNPTILQGEKKRIPLLFKSDVLAQGNYRVVITIETKHDMEDVLIYAGRRRLCYKGKISKGKFVFTTIVNICDFIPRNYTQVYEDKTLDIAIVADRPVLSAVSIVEIQCPTVYIAGDSTVTDQNAEYPYAPGTSYSGWGQMLTAFLHGNIAVSNHAHSGLSTESFREEGHYAIVEKYAKPGDFLVMQFGHNDQKQKHLSAREGYRDNIIRFVQECRSKGMYPIIVTPFARNTWKENDEKINGLLIDKATVSGEGYNDYLLDNALVCKEIGNEMDVPVIDLHGFSKDMIIQMGQESAKIYYYPGDLTHSNDYGAYKMAGFVAQSILRLCAWHEEAAYRTLADKILVDSKEWVVEEEIVLPASDGNGFKIVY